MRKLLFFLIHLWIFQPWQLNAQNPVQNPQDSIYTFSNMKDTAMINAYLQLTEFWRENYFYGCLGQSNIKLSCAKCTAVYLTVQFQVDENGKAVKHNFIKENMCGSNFTEKLRNCFLFYFLNLEFPEALRGKVIQFQIGNGLKC